MRAYVVRAGSDSQDEAFALGNDVVVVGWNEVASLEHADSPAAVRELLEASYDTPVVRNHPGQLWQFCHVIKTGDIVVLPRKSPQPVAIGRVVGPYQYDATRETQKHTRPVKWLHTAIPRTLLPSLGVPLTVY